MMIGVVLTIAGCAGSQHNAAVDAHEGAHEGHALHNLHQFTPDLWSAGEPVGEPAYEELAALGIRTVISVDGVAPNKELALQHGIRVVHLPIGYDGVNAQRTKELAHAIATMPRPIFVNCHHGKHRGPAALCVGAIGAGEITNAQAVAFMTLAGTSSKYHGLWHAADTAQQLSADTLLDDSIELPEQAVIEDFVEAMAEVDRLHEFLWDCADNGFAPPVDNPDLVPISLAGQIHNLLRGMADDQIVMQEGPEFADLLRTNQEHASAVETKLEQNDLAGALESLNMLTDSCNDCHTKYRNNI